MRFRDRVGLLVLLAALGLIAVTTVTLVLLRQSERQLAGIENRYVPLIELHRDLDVMFDDLVRSLEQAATAADERRLADADQLYATLKLRFMEHAHAILKNGGDPTRLGFELDAYFGVARDVTTQLMKGTEIDQLAMEIDTMREAQQRFHADLANATRPDRQRLAAAFETARESQHKAVWIGVLVAIGVLGLMGVLSWRLIRHTVRSLREVSLGVERLARGEFGDEIRVPPGDEIGELAREANQTAARLRDYRANTETLIRETQRQADELLTAYEQLARASKYKSDFLANMSHELRTPLNSVMILSNLLFENADKNLTPKQVEFAGLIQQSGKELLALINEVLDLAKVESGRQSFIYAPLELDELVVYVRRMFEPIAIEKRLAFVVERMEDCPKAINSDEARVTQIVKNLVSNALKFTDHGGVTVRFSKSAAGSSVEIAVIDTGIGIAPQMRSRVFEAFAQADAGISRRYGGTGLGLAIAKQLAMRLGGDIRVESEVGKGSTFTLRLPVAQPGSDTTPLVTPKAKPRPPAPIPSTPLSGRTVLVVDDDARNLYSLSNVLRAKSLVVVTATDGQQALDALEREPNIDAVLMDVMMPRMDGHEAMRRIRAMPKFENLPIVALTAKVMPGEREHCLESGATEYLSKPVDVDRVLDVLRGVLPR